MKILFVSQSPINASISIGNTFLNIFKDFENLDIASVYTKKGYPDKRIETAFRVDEKMIIKGLTLKPAGEIVEKRYQGEKEIDGKTTIFAKRKRWTIFFWLQNLIWCLPFWKSKKLKKFIDDYNPDVVFSVLSDSVPLNRMIRFVHKYTKKPLCLYAWDDNYSMKTCGKSPLKKLNRLFSRVSMRKTVKKASEFYVISNIQKTEYEKFFKRNCKILTKSEDFSQLAKLKESYNKPLQLLYAGNVGMNRWKSLAIIAEVLQKLNQDEIKAQLYIYSGNTLTEQMKEALEVKDTSFFMGSVSADKIQELQLSADMLVHVEGLDKKSQIEVHQSFSTKLVDCFKSARPILAVGPRNVASIEHLIDNECAIVASSEQELYEKLAEFVDDTEKLNVLSLNSYNCGKKHHNKLDMKKMLEEDLFKLCGER